MIDLGGHSSILKAGGRSPDVDLSLGGNLDEMAKKNENGALREALHKNIARGQSVDTIKLELPYIGCTFDTQVARLSNCISYLYLFTRWRHLH